MELLFKEDWPQARRRTEAWYAREIIDRCAVQIRAPRKGVSRPKPPVWASLEQKWTDIETLLDCFDRGAPGIWYGGEAIPIFMPSLGPNVFSAWLGCPLHFAETTTWTDPIIADWRNGPDLKLDRKGRWWKWMTKATKLAAQRGKGKFIVGITDLHGGGDGLAALRGTEALCADLALDPEPVRKAEALVRRLWFDVSEELYALSASEGQDGSAGFLGWGSGRTWPLQEDLFALISPKMGREFFMEAIAEQARRLDHSVFHLDGPESLPHLDALLDIPELDGIQWQPGAAHMEMTQWIPLIQRIQSKGKCVLFRAMPAEIEKVLAATSARGLMITTSVATEDEGRALLKKVGEWTK